MADDPCGFVPDTVIPAGLKITRQHASFPVLGRITKRPRPLPVHAAQPHPLTGGGCERQLSRGSLPRAPLPLLVPAVTALGVLGAAGLVTAGGLFGGLATHRTMHKGHGKDGSTPVPEPSSALVLFVAMLCVLAARLRSRSPVPGSCRRQRRRSEPDGSG